MNRRSESSPKSELFSSQDRGGAFCSELTKQPGAQPEQRRDIFAATWLTRLLETGTLLLMVFIVWTEVGLSALENEVVKNDAVHELVNSKARAREAVRVQTNAIRKQRRMKPLQMDPELSQIAQAFAEDMRVNDYFSHTSPNGSTMTTRLAKANFRFSTSGENIAKGQPTPEVVVESWLKSPGHRANMLNPRFQKIGVGYDGDIWVQVFTD